MPSWGSRPCGPTACTPTRPAPRATVVVVPPCRRRGVGTALWQAVAPSAATPVVTALWGSQVGGLAFAARHGFEPFRHSWLATLALDRWAVSAAHEALRADLPGIGDTTLDTLDPSDWPALLALIRRTYEHNHRDNPVASLADQEWTRLVWEDDLDVPGSRVIWHNHTVAGFVLLHRSRRSGRLEWGWMGVEPGMPPDALAHALGAQVLYAVATGAHHLDVEVDSTDTACQSVLAALPFPPSPTWIALRRPPRE